MSKLETSTSKIAEKVKLYRQPEIWAKRYMTPFTSAGDMGNVSSTPKPKLAGITEIIEKPKNSVEKLTNHYILYNIIANANPAIENMNRVI